jgi:hypothetical protein
LVDCNRNIKAKIRQQLQEFRGRNLLLHIGRNRWRIDSKYTTPAGNGSSAPANWNLVNLPSGFSNVDRVTLSFGTAGSGMGLDNYTFSPVPEPSTLALAALAGAGLLLFRRRRV